VVPITVCAIVLPESALASLYFIVIKDQGVETLVTETVSALWCAEELFLANAPPAGRVRHAPNTPKAVALHQTPFLKPPRGRLRWVFLSRSSFYASSE